MCGKKENVDTARLWRKVLGGGMGQAGIIAAAGLYALDNNIVMFEEDHQNLQLLREKFEGIKEFEIISAATNMLFVKLLKGDPAALAAALRNEGILILPGRIIRFVTHLDVEKSDISITADAVKRYFS